MVNRRGLMISTMLMSAVGIGGVVGNVGNAWAQCATEDCATLGYTESYNSSGNCLKCPFGEAYNCEAGYICPEGYEYACNGENMVAVGEACNGKYASCNCAEGYNLQNGSCVEKPWGKCSGIAAQCSLGDILFSDETCNTYMVWGKTPIAVVVYKSGNCGQAIALNSIGNYYWSTEAVDISDLSNSSHGVGSGAARYNYASCENSEKIRAQGDSSKYPAVWAAYNYSTEGTKVGDWCLPAAGILLGVSAHSSLIYSGLIRAGGTQFTDKTYVWSSSEFNSSNAWYFSDDGEDVLYDTIKTLSYEVRPVIEF